MNFLEKKLNQRREQGTLRSLNDLAGLVDFCSNDYLGYSKISFEQDVFLHHGSTGSRLISGNSFEAIEAENRVAQFFNTESALIFNSGYDANLGFFSSVPQKGDLVLFDQHIHASVRDGIRLSFAKSASFEHNSVEDLERKLNNLQGVTKFVAMESLYSMGGDMSPISAMLKICEKHNAHLIVDEAHAIGVFGEKGKGICNAFDFENRIFARLVTFGKAYGSHGAAILGSTILKEFLLNFARSFIYTTALPPESYQRISAVLETSDFESKRNALFENIVLFRSLLEHKKQLLISEINSPIQIIQLGDSQKSIAFAEKCKVHGLALKAILSPTVSVGSEGIRICLHAFNTASEIELLVQLLDTIEH
jgi:8-amino-7-oxononanoate synthase